MGMYHGIRTEVFSNPFLSLEVLAERAARVVRLVVNGENLFAETPDYGWDTPGGHYSIYGGHRLWHAPQVAGRTDAPDDAGVLTVERGPDGADLFVPADPLTRISRRIEIRLEPAGAVVRLKHVLKNEGVWAVECAPWTITQVPLGGQALVPLAPGPLGGNGSAPNRSVQFWPGFRLPEPRLILQDRWIRFRLDARDGDFKLGTFSPAGWIGYARENTFFRKRFETRLGPAYPDGGCNVEIYHNHRFAELEALGPLSSLQPGETAELHETWEVCSLEEGLAGVEEEIREALQD